ncbi:MAG: hypothetical protein QI199_02990, partial [Candidatus Korarchaeota archaeon]|nr:hypothetical protein [Candidatus Korarchaeota archaeon]
MLPLVVRESFPLLPSWTPIVMYSILVPFALIFLYGLWRISRKFELVRALKELDHGKLRRGLIRVLSQKRVLERNRGFFHALLFAGTLVLFLGTLTVFLETDILEHLGIRIL